MNESKTSDEKLGQTGQPTEPGELDDPELGVPGDAEPLPQDDDLQEEVTHVNDDDDLDEDDD